MIRNEIEPLANAASHKKWFDKERDGNQEIEEKYKYLKGVVFNEAENLSKEAQASLRELMERVEKRCKFIFMTNKMDKIDEAIISRILLVQITEPPINDIIKHMENILDEEGVSYEDGILATYIQKVDYKRSGTKLAKYLASS